MEHSHLKKQLEWAWGMTAGFRGKIGLEISLEILSAAFGFAFIFWSKKAVDIAMGAEQGSLRLGLFYIAFFLGLNVLLSVIASWISESVRIQITIRLQNSLEKTQMLSAWTQTKQWHTGDLLVRMNSDSNEVTQMLAYSLPMFLATFIKLIASISYLWIMDPMLAWMILSISPLLLFSKFYYKKVRELSKSVKKAESLLGTVLQENLRSRLLIRALQARETRWKKLIAVQDEILKFKTRQLKFSTATQGIMKITFNGGYLLAFLWGIYRLYSHEISVGTMISFLQLVGKIQMPIFSLIAFIPAVIRNTTAIDRLVDLYKGEKENECSQKQISAPHRLCLENVSFRYDDQKVIENFTGSFEIGQPKAIIGSSGKGKTTLIRLMLALVKPEEGDIYFMAGDSRHPVSMDTRTNFSYVPQGNTLFSGTIRENLLLAKQSATNPELEEVLKLACADFVFLLPGGLNTTIGELGYGLSEGQAQRIAIARALLRNSSVWLFDEITSALDAKTSKQLISNLFEAGKERIMIFVTHDLRLAEACSQTIRIN
jgi:ATP-binding cassette, subfamily B, bacterial